MTRLTKTLLGSLVLSIGLMGAAGATPSRAHVQKLTVPVDRQDYTTSFTMKNPVDGSTIDEYNADPSSIHVAVKGGRQSAQSYLHLALDYLPKGATITESTLTLYVTQQGDASSSGVYPLYNTNLPSVILEACALKTPLGKKFDSSKPPAYDCQHGSSVGKPNKARTRWTFKLPELVAYWRQHGNTGAALLPVTADAGETWSVAFYKSRSSATVKFTTSKSSVTPPVTTPTAPASTPHGGSGASSSTTGGSDGSGSGTGSTSTGSGTSSGTGSGSTTVNPPSGGTTTQQQPSGSTPNVATPPQSTTTGQPAAASDRRDNGKPVWPFVLVGCVLLALIAVGAANRQLVATRLAAAHGPGMAMFRTHPRAYTVASASLAWGLVFSTYSVVTSPAGTHGSDASNTASDSTAPSGNTSTLPDGTTPTGGGNSSVTAPGATSGGGVTGGTGGTPAGSGQGASTPNAATSGGAGHGQAATTTGSTTPTQELAGPGSTRTIDGIPVFFPAKGGPPVAKLYGGADDTIGLTPNSLKICAHAALTYGAAFHISADDLDVFWKKINDQGGIFGRKVLTNYQNDNYDPGQAVQAAQACKDWNTFLLLGGIGFDQIPAVRQWAEQNHELYLHHIATTQGAAGKRYSFSSLPSVEQVGKWFGQLATTQFKGQKIGILYRNSSNWTPGVSTFTQIVKAAGGQIVGSYAVTNNQGNYTQELTQLRSKGAQVVFGWENALSEIEMIKQAESQNWHPAWLVNGFNIITNTLGKNALDQQMWGPAEWESYDPHYYGGGFSSYASDIKEFEAEYKKYDSGADLGGDGGDLLFLNWEAQRGLYDLLKQCGPTCTRNKLAGLLLAGFHGTTKPLCPVDFRGVDGDHHHGGYLTNVIHAVRDPNGRANFVPVRRCVGNI